MIFTLPGSWQEPNPLPTINCAGLMTGRIFHTLALAPPLLNCRSSLPHTFGSRAAWHFCIMNQSQILGVHIYYSLNCVSRPTDTASVWCLLLTSVSLWGSSWQLITGSIFPLAVLGFAFLGSPRQNKIWFQTLFQPYLTLLTKDMRSSLGPEIRYIFPLQAKQWVIKHGADSFCS